MAASIYSRSCSGDGPRGGSLLRGATIGIALSALIFFAGCSPDAGNDETSSSESAGEVRTGTGGEGSSTSGSQTSDSDETTSVTETETDSADSGNFPGDSDLGSSCGAECDPWLSNDCPEGEKCTAVSCESNTWDVNVCRDIQGDAQPGDECTITSSNQGSGNDTCAERSICFDVDSDTGTGHCVAFCTGSAQAPECAAQSSCVILNDGALPLCMVSCDPLADDCAADELCLPNGEDYGCLSAAPTTGPYGTPCTDLTYCDAGLLCALGTLVPEPGCDESNPCCTPVCRLSDPEPCPGVGQSCEALPDNLPPGFDLGVCVLPS